MRGDPSSGLARVVKKLTPLLLLSLLSYYKKSNGVDSEILPNSILGKDRKTETKSEGRDVKKLK